MTGIQLLKPTSYDIKMENDKNENRFNFYCLIVWVFVICCTIGFIVETVYALIKKGSYINKQGMLYGPFKPIYGFGGVLFTILFYKIRHYRCYVLFIAGAVTGALYEYICSYIQQILMKSQSWDYSAFKYNIGGRINPIHAVFWGILAMLFIKFILPLIITTLNYVPTKIQIPLCIILTVFMIINMSLSLCAVTRQVERLEGKSPSNSFEAFLDVHYNDERIKNTFTHMKFVYVNEDNQ